jgi:ATP-dependent exoDNAse (exonuclease V) beta subunit
MPTELTPDSVTPSGLGTTDVGESISERVVARYGNGLDIKVGLTGTALGNFLHRCFEVLGANPGVANRLSMITGVELEDGIARNIADCVAQFEGWLKQQFELQSVARELPLLALDEHGSVLSGVADLVIETANGLWIIDHKSDQVNDPDGAFKNYRPQLKAYAKALVSEGATVLGIGINWIRSGEVVVERI